MAMDRHQNVAVSQNRDIRCYTSSIVIRIRSDPQLLAVVSGSGKKNNFGSGRLRIRNELLK
jgi:hypothetical protein